MSVVRTWKAATMMRYLTTVASAMLVLLALVVHLESLSTVSTGAPTEVPPPAPASRPASAPVQLPRSP